MSVVDTMRALARYDRLVFEAFERGLRRRGWAEATRDRGIGHGSYKNTLVHVLNVHEAWFVGAAQRQWGLFDDARRRPENVRSWADLRRYRLRVWAETDPLLRGLTETQLRRRVRVPWIAGRYTLEDAFFQVSFEQAHHFGEIIGASWQAHRASPQMMWIPTTRGIRLSVA